MNPLQFGDCSLQGTAQSLRYLFEINDRLPSSFLCNLELQLYLSFLYHNLELHSGNPLFALIRLTYVFLFS